MFGEGIHGTGLFDLDNINLGSPDEVIAAQAAEYEDRIPNLEDYRSARFDYRAQQYIEKNYPVLETYDLRVAYFLEDRAIRLANTALATNISDNQLAFVKRMLGLPESATAEEMQMLCDQRLNYIETLHRTNNRYRSVAHLIAGRDAVRSGRVSFDDVDDTDEMWTLWERWHGNPEHE